jgi:hypothetical protein
MPTTPITVTLPSTVTYTIAPVKTTTLTTLTITRIADTQSNQSVIAFVNEIPGPVTLWAGQDYINIGNWTQAQAEAQLIAVVSGTAVPVPAPSN